MRTKIANFRPPITAAGQYQVLCNALILRNQGTTNVIIDYNYTLSPGATLSLGSTDDDSVFAQTLNIQPATPGDAVNVQRVEILIEGAAGAFTNPNPKQSC